MVLVFHYWNLCLTCDNNVQRTNPGRRLIQTLAKKAALQSVDPELTPYDFRMAQCCIKKQANWKAMGTVDSSHSYGKATLGSGPQRFLPCLNWRQEVELSRLRTSHHRLVKLPRSLRVLNVVCSVAFQELSICCLFALRPGNW